MADIIYLHWHAGEAAAHVRPLKAAGHRVRTLASVDAAADFITSSPDALVISLDRLPSHGQAVAAVFWEAKKRHQTPIVFVGGATDKVRAAQAKFKTAIFCHRNQLTDVVGQISSGSLTIPVVATVRRPSTSDYSGKPLPQKLGLTEGQRVAFLHAPEDWDSIIGPMPANVLRYAKPVKDLDMVVLFVTEALVLAKEFPKLTERMAAKGMIWVAWPKKSAKVNTDVDENTIREVGLKKNWVDVKVCAISEIWSGLKFLRRK